jgi:hypothetical protein
MKHHKFHGKSEHVHGEIEGYHGSPHESHETHGGKVGVPHELMVGAGPGRASERVRPHMGTSAFEGGSKTSGKSKGMKTDRSDDEG